MEYDMGNVGTIVLPRYLVRSLIRFHIPVSRYFELSRTHIKGTCAIARNPRLYDIRVRHGSVTATGGIGNFPICDVIGRIYVH